MTNASETNVGMEMVKSFPLGQPEFVQSVSAPPQNSQAPVVILTGKADHVSIGRAMIEYDFVCKIEGILAIWSGDHYELGQEVVHKRIFDYDETLTRNKRAEVISYLEHCAPRYDMAPSNLIAFKNGVLDTDSMQLLDPSPWMLIPNIIPHNWNPEAECAELEEVLDAWSCNDSSVRLNLEETIGLCMCRTRDLRDAPILCGEGCNGKSTFLNFLVTLMGHENVSALDLAMVGARFQSVALAGKLVNIGDDISNEYIKGDRLAIVKKVISGDWVPAEYKGGATFKFRPYCKMVFSCNEFPRLGDHSAGIFSRLIPIPFEADFANQSGQCNLHLGRVLEREEVCEAAIVLGVEALKGCLARGGMTRGVRQMETLEQVKQSNSSVYQFCCEELRFGEEDPVNILYIPTADLYQNYVDYCAQSHLKPVARTSFTTEMRKIYKVNNGRQTIGGKQVRCLVP